MFQAAVYSVWKERNSRLLNWIIRALDSTVKEVQLQLRSKLFALDREDDHTFPHSSHHHTTPTSSQSRTYVSHLLIKQCIFNCISQKQYPDFFKKEKKKTDKKAMSATAMKRFGHNTQIIFFYLQPNRHRFVLREVQFRFITQYIHEFL